MRSNQPLRVFLGEHIGRRAERRRTGVSYSGAAAPVSISLVPTKGLRNIRGKLTGKLDIQSGARMRISVRRITVSMASGCPSRMIEAAPQSA
jgi:hypothetical protein